MAEIKFYPPSGKESVTVGLTSGHMAVVNAEGTVLDKLFHAEAIAHGVAALLYAQPDRPWSDPKRANFHRAEFVEGWRRAGRFRKQHSAPTQVEFHNPPRKHSFF